MSCPGGDCGEQKPKKVDPKIPPSAKKNVSSAWGNSTRPVSIPTNPWGLKNSTAKNKKK